VPLLVLNGAENWLFGKVHQTGKMRHQESRNPSGTFSVNPNIIRLMTISDTGGEVEERLDLIQ